MTRIPKIEDFLKKEISQIISSQVQDKRFKFLNIVDVKVSGDLGIATVYFTIINGNKSDAPDVKSLEKFGINNCQNYIPIYTKWFSLNNSNWNNINPIGRV